MVFWSPRIYAEPSGLASKRRRWSTDFHIRGAGRVPLSSAPIEACLWRAAQSAEGNARSRLSNCGVRQDPTGNDERESQGWPSTRREVPRNDDQVSLTRLSRNA